MKEKKSIKYKGIDCDSNEELFFLMWCFELKEKGFIERVERCPTFRLTEGWVNQYEEVLKTKTRVKNQSILKPSEYTPDVLITFSDSLWDKLVWLKPYNSLSRYDRLFIGTNESRINYILNQKDGSYPPKTQVIVEVKSPFDYQNMSRLFGLNRKFLYEKYKLFVNLVKIPDFFKETFVPQEYLKTSTGKDRKINFEYRNCDDFLNSLK